MAWNSDYGRDFPQRWISRGGGRDFEPGWHEHMSWSRPYGGRQYGRDFGYDWQFRRTPERSPAYGRGGDREVRRWAREHGYDEGFEIRPREGTWSAGRPYGSDFRRSGPSGWRAGHGWGDAPRPESRWERGYQW